MKKVEMIDELKVKKT